MKYTAIHQASEAQIFFNAHIAHLSFLNDFLLQTELVNIDMGHKVKVLEKLSQLLVRDYVFGDDFKQKALSLGERGLQMYSELIQVINIQIAYCGQIGGDKDKLKECVLLLKQLVDNPIA